MISKGSHLFLQSPVSLYRWKLISPMNGNIEAFSFFFTMLSFFTFFITSQKTENPIFVQIPLLRPAHSACSGYLCWQIEQWGSFYSNTPAVIHSPGWVIVTLFSFSDCIWNLNFVILLWKGNGWGGLGHSR